MIGQLITLVNFSTTCVVRVIAVYHYDTLEAYIDGSGWKTVAPHCSSREETIAAYRKIVDVNGDLVFSDAAIQREGGMNALLIRRE